MYKLLKKLDKFFFNFTCLDYEEYTIAYKMR
jgi:hypothetical protein